MMMWIVVLYARWGAILVGFLGMKGILGLGLRWFPLHWGYEEDLGLKIAGVSSSYRI